MTGKTTIIDTARDRRVLIGEQATDVYLRVEHSTAFLNPLDAIRAGLALVRAGTAALDRQFNRQFVKEGSASVGEGNNHTKGAPACRS